MLAQYRAVATKYAFLTEENARDGDDERVSQARAVLTDAQWTEALRGIRELAHLLDADAIEAIRTELLRDTLSDEQARVIEEIGLAIRELDWGRLQEGAAD